MQRVNFDMSLLYESMTKLCWGSWTIRIWRQYDEGFTGSSKDIQAVLESMLPAHTPEDLLAKLLVLERVNAVEILDVSGCGTVVYKDWS